METRIHTVSRNVSIVEASFRHFDEAERVGRDVSEFYVYRGDSLIRVCPSIGMAREVAAGC